MHDDATCERLVAVGFELPGLPEAIGDPRQVSLRGEHVGEAAPTFDRLRGAREILLRQECSLQSVARRQSDVERLAHRAEHLAQARRLCRSDPERPDELLFGQAKQPARRGRCPEHPGGSGDVPADVIVRRIDRVADSALDLGSQDESVNERFPGDRPVLGEREQRRCNRAGRVNDGLEMRIVEVERVRCHAVEQRRVEDVEAFAPTQHGRLRRSREERQRSDGALRRIVVRGPDRAAEPVEDRSLGFPPHAFWQLVRVGVRDKAGEGERRFGSHGGGRWLAPAARASEEFAQLGGGAYFIRVAPCCPLRGPGMREATEQVP